MRDAAPPRLRRFQKPWISAALLLTLFADAVWVSDTSSWTRPLEGVRRAVLNQPAGATVPPDQRWSWVTRSENGFRFVDSRVDAAIADVEVAVDYSSPTTGRWAPTTRHFDSRLKAHVYQGPSLTPPERDEIRELFASAIAPEIDFGELQRFLREPENSNIEVPVASGYAHNAGAIAVLAALIWSLAWAPRMLILRTQAARRARGLCPHCCYEVRGLPMPICPECGELTW